MRCLLRPLWRALCLGWALALLTSAVAAEAPGILLANVYRQQVDVTQYLVSEKLDGVRAIWDGQTLRFRSGREIKAPDWFIASLPKQALDGELWLGRGRFEKLSGIVRREQPDETAWRQVRYMIFELPGAPGTFSERAAEMRRLVAQTKLPWLQEIEQLNVVDRSSLQKRLKAVVKAGGEGLMLHRADALYETGRSDTLLKLKPWADAEAIVIGHLPGKGKYVGMLGALRVRSANGREFSLGAGLSDEERRNPPAIGTQVTYRRCRFHWQQFYPRLAGAIRRAGDQSR
jgi:DNA ligase-1